jgi:hypothetical protein
LPRQRKSSCGGGAPIGNPGGRHIWYGTAAPLNTVGANGDYYVNTTSYCLYGPKTAGAWPSACVTSVSQLGYVAEYVGNKGAAGGYAPLDANALVPAAESAADRGDQRHERASNSASDQTYVTTAPAVGAWTSSSVVPRYGGNHLNYSVVTHGFLCGNTGGTVGSVGFSGVGSGTNANALLVSGTLGYPGGGTDQREPIRGRDLSPACRPGF